MRDGGDQRRKVLARGTVLLDPKAALAKMRAYQLADPVSYVLELVRAAVWAGATEVHIENDSDDLILWHDGPAPRPDDLTRILEHLFSVDDRRLRLLAVAINTALGLGVRFLDLYTTHEAPEGKVMRVRWTPNPARKATKNDDDDSPFALATQSHVDRPVGMPAVGFRIHVREAFGVEVMREWFRRDPRETQLLRRHVHRLPVPLWRGRDNLVPTEPAPTLAAVRFQAADLEGVVALVAPDDPRANSLEFHELGVLLEARPLRPSTPTEPLPPLWMSVDARALPTNVSRSKVDTSGSLGAALTRAWSESLDALVTQGLEALRPDTPWTTPRDPRGPLHDALLAWILSGGTPWTAHMAPAAVSSAEAILGETPLALRQRLLDAPLVPIASGGFETPRQAARSVEGHLLWRGDDPIEADLTPWIQKVLWTQRRSRPLLTLLEALHPRDADVALRAAQEARTRYTRFRAHPPQAVTVPPSGPELVRVTVGGPDEAHHGVLIVPAAQGEGAASLHLRAFLEGRPFANEDVDIVAWPLIVALEGPGVRPTASFDAIDRAAGLTEALLPVRRAFVDAIETLAALWSKALPPDDPRGQWMGDAAERLPEDTRRALVRAAWVELSRLNPDPTLHAKTMTEGLMRCPALAGYPAWHTTVRGRFVSLSQIVAQGEPPPRAVLRAGWTVQGARRDGREVVKTQRQEETTALSLALVPEVKWVDIGDRLPTRTTADLRLLLWQGDPLRDDVPALGLERPLARGLVGPLDGDRGLLHLAHHGTVLGSRPRDGALGPMAMLLEDDACVPSSADRWALRDVLGPEAVALQIEAEVALVETLALALQGDRVARGRLRGPLDRLQHPAVRRLLLTALGRLHTQGPALARQGITPAQQTSLRETLRQTPMLHWFGPTGETLPTSPAQIEDELGPEGQRSLSFVAEVPAGVDPDDLRALVLLDRGMRPWVESALQARLVHVGDDLPRLRAKARRRKARASLAQRPRVAFDDPTSLRGVGPGVTHSEGGAGKVLAVLGRDAARGRVEVMVDGVVALSLQLKVPDELPVALGMRVEFARTQSLADDLSALTTDGLKALKALCLGAAPLVLDALLSSGLDPTALEPARGLVLRWAEGTQGKRGAEITRRKAEIARAPLWPTVGGAVVSLAALVEGNKRLPYAVLADEVEWIAPSPGEAPDPRVIRVRSESEAKALALLVKVSADAQTAPIERLQRARRLRAHARDRIRLPGEAPDKVLSGRLEDLDPGLGVGELRLVSRDNDLRLSLFLDDGKVLQRTRPAPLGLDLALGSAEVDPAEVEGSLASIDLVPRLLDAARILLGRLLTRPPAAPPPWIERALRWYLFTTKGLDDAARKRSVARDTTGAPLALQDLDDQIHRFRSVAYVTSPPAEPVPSSIPGRRVAVLSAPELRWLLSLRAADDFSSRIDDDLAAQRWARATPAPAVRLPDGAKQRVLAQRIHDVPEADVALLGWDAVSVGEVYWSVTRRPLGQSPLHTPWPAAVALEAPGLTPNGRRTGPQEDPAFHIAMRDAAALVESLLRDELGPPDDAWASLPAHDPKGVAWSSGICTAVGWLWLMPHQRPGRVRVHTASGDRWIGNPLLRGDGSAYGGGLKVDVPVHGHLWVKTRSTQSRTEQEALARRTTELLVRWAWPRLLEALCKHEAAATSPVGWWHLCLGALAEQLGHGALRDYARKATPPGAKLTLQRIQRAIGRAEPLERGTQVVGPEAPWMGLLQDAGMLVTPAPLTKAEEPAKAAPAKPAPPKPAPAAPKAPAPAVVTPTESAVRPKKEAAEVTARFALGESTLTLLFELGLDRTALRAVEADGRPCSVHEALVQYDPRHKIAQVRVEHPAVLKLRQGAARRAAEVLAVAVLGAVNRALEGVNDADEERILAGLLERVRRA